MNKYNPQEIEAKWQKFWEDNKTFAVTEDASKEKFYGLIEFPYPSGAGLHVGHPRSYTAMDVITRKKRMEGKNVLFPIGFDSFGLPTENFAIKTGRPPQEITDENIATFTRQLKSLGFGFDWGRAVTTSEPEYYKWTQWIFLQLYKHGLAYKANQPINWCPKDKIGLANEEVVDGACERCGTPVEKRNKEQWMLAITKYADKLLEGLNEVDYISRAKVQQENWIGKSEGAEINFKLNVPGQEPGKHSVTVFTTRPDTLFGATFLAISAELAKKWLDVGWQTSDEVKKYIAETLQSRTTAVAREDVEKTGVATNVTAVNPASGEQIPVWIVNYVMGDYGTGAIMAVPAHDERDFEFAQKYSLPIKIVVHAEHARYLVIEKSLPKNSVAKLNEFGIVSVERTEKDWGKFFQVTVESHKEENFISFLKENLLKTSDGGGSWYADSIGTTNVIIFNNKVFRISNFDQFQNFVEYGRSVGIPEDQLDIKQDIFVDDGVTVDSDFLSGLSTFEAKEKIIQSLEEKGIGKREIKFKLRDWVFSRQRYWGEPIPLVFCENCKNIKHHYVIIHGYTGTGDKNGIAADETDNWRLKLRLDLEKQGNTVYCPDLPNTNEPNINEQVDFILKNTKIDENTILIGHSLGGVVIYKLLEKLNKKVAKVLLVDPVVSPKFPDRARPMVEKSNDWKFDFEKIKQLSDEFIVLGDASFRTIFEEDLRKLSDALGGSLVLSQPIERHFLAAYEPIIWKLLEQTGWVPLPENQLPLTLPHVEKYLPTDTGESPLAPMTDWVNTKCPKCGGPARRETDTMPNWAGSSWYWLRYADPHNAQNFFAETDFRFKPEIEVTEKDQKYIEAFKKIYSDLDAQGVPIFAANRLLLNGLNGRLWLPLKTVSVMYWDRDTKKVFAYLKEQGYTLTTENKGGHLFERDGVRVEMIPVFEEKGKFVSYSSAGVEQPMTIADLVRTESAHLQGFWYRTVSPEYNLRHLVYVRDHESDGRADERDQEKIEFLESYLKNINSKIRYFTPVDWYNGGMEHTVLHLLYSRFWNQFLYDIGVVPTREPYKKRTSHGMILASDGQKMSKSLGNVINPDEMVQQFGADALRMYILFMGPFDQAVSWDTNGLVGVRRFLEKVWNYFYSWKENYEDDIKINKKNIELYQQESWQKETDSLLQKTIKKVTEDIENMRFNTAVSQLMIFINHVSRELVGGWEEKEPVTLPQMEKFIKILSPFAPHIAEELWGLIGHSSSITNEEWPKYNESKISDSKITVVVQVNGKVRDQFVVSPEISEEEIKQMALSSEKVTKWLEGKEPKKVIYVKGKLVSIVV